MKEKKAMKVILNCLPGIFNVKIAEKAKKNTHVFSQHQSDSIHFGPNAERQTFSCQSCADDYLDFP